MKYGPTKSTNVIKSTMTDSHCARVHTSHVHNSMYRREVMCAHVHNSMYRREVMCTHVHNSMYRREMMCAQLYTTPCTRWEGRKNGGEATARQNNSKRNKKEKIYVCVYFTAKFTLGVIEAGESPRRIVVPKRAVCKAQSVASQH